MEHNQTEYASQQNIIRMTLINASLYIQLLTYIKCIVGGPGLGPLIVNTNPHDQLTTPMPSWGGHKLTKTQVELKASSKFNIISSEKSKNL